MDQFNHSTTYQIIDRLNEKKKEFQVKYNKVRNIITGLTLIVTAIISYALYSVDLIYLVIAPIFGGGSVILVTYLVIASVLKNKLVREFFNEEVMNIYNQENGTFYEYTASPKIKNEFNREMGLFPRHAVVAHMFQIKGSNDDLPFDLRELSLTISTGNSSQVVFSGFYFIFPVSGEKVFQIRTNGRPSVKKQKFQKEVLPTYRTFVPEDDMSGVKQKYIKLYEMLEREFDYSRMYIGSNEDEVHIALTPKVKTKYPKEIDENTFEVYSESFMKTFKVLDEIVSSINSEF